MKTRLRFETYNWKLVWNTRLTNGLADLAAKKSLSSDYSFAFDVSNFDTLPKD